MTIKDQVAPKKRQPEQNTSICIGKHAGKTVLLMSMEQLKALAHGKPQGENA
ncbi:MULTISPECIES: hypothetical protein [Pseudoalteromonas]|uniref:Uncharacterized protein n=1 Tax=Pseudoalteromonas galatheae TaxID=579562 RepID=A0A8T6Z030_9GAMM|nr:MULTISPECIES: hypothetical protein [Pseudoalteromonas]MCF2829783.1 hypothetical protein [Pseudoalteromonas sp. OF5H-5]MCF2927749.1 hypothetical protein [Pseudoalteromonas sp. DL2-H1]MCG9760706.1 hypothetical protein [Pseudoalteromonas sp. Isolate6]NKC21600.1 hypothetical protein [Pseudoalteromonas galatheae]QQQ68568.1 hypothetical protein JJQ94_12555 [Pseudoalteromonas sp. GCY]